MYNQEYNMIIHKLNMPKYSFIVAMYNIERYINRCIDSILAQTCKDYEIVVVNDGSTDGSLNKLENYQDKIKIINKENGGLSSARNEGLKVAKGDYILFIDGDDCVKQDYLENFNYHITQKEYDILFAGYTDCKKNGAVVYKYNEFMNVETYEEIFMKMLGPRNTEKLSNRYNMSVWGKCYKRNFLINNNIIFKSEKEYVSEDMIFHSDIYEFKPKVKFVFNVGYCYIHNDYLSLTKIFKPNRIEKECCLHKYLMSKSIYYTFNDKDKYRIYNRFLERIGIVINNQITLKNKKEIFNFKELDEALQFCGKFKMPFFSFVRYVCLKLRSYVLIKLIYALRKIKK